MCDDIVKKTCSKCKASLPLGSFHKKLSGLHGRDSRCIMCISKIKKVNYKKKKVVFEIEEATQAEIREESIEIFLNYLKDKNV